MSKQTFTMLLEILSGCTAIQAMAQAMAHENNKVRTHKCKTVSDIQQHWAEAIRNVGAGQPDLCTHSKLGLVSNIANILPCP